MAGLHFEFWTDQAQISVPAEFTASDDKGVIGRDQGPIAVPNNAMPDYAEPFRSQ